MVEKPSAYALSIPAYGTEPAATDWSVYVKELAFRGRLHPCAIHEQAYYIISEQRIKKKIKKFSPFPAQKPISAEK